MHRQHHHHLLVLWVVLWVVSSSDYQRRRIVGQHLLLLLILKLGVDNHPDDIKASSFFDDEGEEKEKLSLPGDEDEEKEEEFSLPDDVDVAAMGMKSRSFEVMESTAALTKQQMNDQLVAMIISMKEHGFKDEDLKETVQSGICGYKDIHTASKIVDLTTPSPPNSPRQKSRYAYAAQVISGIGGLIAASSRAAPYEAPSRETIESLVQQYIHQPEMPGLEILMSTDAWKQEVTYAMSAEGMANAPKGHARIDKKMSDKNGFRILRDFVRNKDGKFVEPDLEEKCPLLFAFLKILLEEYGVTHVALQQMVKQEYHCDPFARHASPERDARTCHVLLTVFGDHSFGISSSSKIQTLDHRFVTWTGGGCGAVKIEYKHLNDILLIRRYGKTPFQAILHTLLGGIIAGAFIPIHAGVPGSKDTGDGWMTSQEYGQFQQARDRAFREVGGVGVDTSVSLVCNYFGTQTESAAAFEVAATRALQVHEFSMDASRDVLLTKHMRDLVVFRGLLSRGMISNLSFKPGDFWSKERIEEHYKLGVEKGASKRGAMVGTKKEEHYKKCTANNGNLRGPMPDGPDKDAYTKKSMKGDAVTHIANMVAGHEKKNALLLQLANGKLKQGHEWTESCRKNGSGVIYTFTNGNGGVQIEGKRDFEAYLLKRYVSEELTEDGKSAYAAMEKKRNDNNKRNVQNAEKKKRAN